MDLKSDRHQFKVKNSQGLIGMKCSKPSRSYKLKLDSPICILIDSVKEKFLWRIGSKLLTPI